MTLFLLLAALLVYLGLLYVGRGYQAWLAGGLLFWLSLSSAGCSAWLLVPLALLLIGAGLLFGVGDWRQRFVAAPLMRSMAKVLPRLGETERIALEAGSVWWDGELFSGKPNWQRLLDFRVPPPEAEVQAFLDGPVATLCEMLDDWQIQQDRDLPPAVWDFLREHRFFGMIIPTEYGGLGFGADAHSRVVTRVASRSVTAAVTVMVPNSLGPAELLLHYGTEAQRQHYLPRLASGQDLPCFALTGPEAGSDAAATQSLGIVEAREIDGERVLGMRLNWKKRYITLAPVATLVGLAFRLQDPDGLLGEAGRDYGITCALIPRDTPGVQIGQRHDPMGVPFMNGPTVGEDVWVPLTQIIGGVEGAGEGWK
ncbi:MAG: acyl-CoA dehydrogenase family protein, partial [Xanthomonadales bacterium]|nr:acyl-CoA dehydrogenase family protein [Xanthomonadales bacterium]